MSDASVCPHCGSTLTRAVQCDGGPHHARVVCDRCGRTLRWIPRPSDGAPPAWLVARCQGRTGLADLHGTEAQVRWARSIRAGMLRSERDEDRSRILRSIADASWFIAHVRRGGPLRWPVEGQLAADLAASVGPR